MFFVSSVARVVGRSGVATGAAFLVSRSGLVVTCTHVVQSAGYSIDDEVRLVFSTRGREYTVYCVPKCWHDADKEDVCILELLTAPPSSITPLELAPISSASSEEVHLFGFPQLEGVDGIHATGLVGGVTRIHGLQYLQLVNTGNVTVGHSGSPIWLPKQRRCIGMLSHITSPDHHGRLAGNAFAIPAETILRVCPELGGAEVRESGSHSMLVQATEMGAIQRVGADNTPPSYSAHANRVKDFIDEYLGSSHHIVPFGGRAKELAVLDQWLGSSADRPYALVAAPAGRGKSALLVRWAHEVARSEIAHVIIVPISIRFNTASDVDTYQILATELAEIHGESLPVGNLPREAWFETYREYLKRPALDGKPILIILDGLDEATGRQARDVLLPTSPPPHLRAIVSARLMRGDVDGQGWLERLGWQGKDLATLVELNPLTEEGIRSIINMIGERTVGFSAPDSMITQLYRVTEGDPLLIRLYIDQLVSRQGTSFEWTEADLSSMEIGLKGFFDRWWEDQEELWRLDDRNQSHAKATVQALLDLLSFSLGPLYAIDIHSLAPNEFASGREIYRALNDLGRFVIGDASESGLVFAHSRLGQYFAEQLLDDEIHGLKQTYLDYGAHTLARLKRGSLELKRVSPYVIQHYGEHLEQALADGWDVDSNLSDLLSHEWLRASRLRDPSLSTFGRDVDRVWLRALETSNHPLLVKAAICRSSLITILNGLDPRVAREMLARQIVSPALMIGTIAKLSTVATQVQFLVRTAPLTTGMDFQRCLSLVEELPVGSRIEVFATMIPLLVPGSAEREAAETAVLDSIEQFPGNINLGIYLEQIASYLTGPRLVRAWTMCQSNVEMPERLNAASAILTAIEPDIAHQLWHRFEALPDDHFKSLLLLTSLGSLPSSLYSNAWEFVVSVDDEWLQASMIASIAPYLNDTNRAKAWHQVWTMIGRGVDTSTESPSLPLEVPGQKARPDPGRFRAQLAELANTLSLRAVLGDSMGWQLAAEALIPLMSKSDLANALETAKQIKEPLLRGALSVQLVARLGTQLGVEYWLRCIEDISKQAHDDSERRVGLDQLQSAFHKQIGKLSSQQNYEILSALTTSQLEASHLAEGLKLRSREILEAALEILASDYAGVRKIATNQILRALGENEILEMWELARSSSTIDVLAEFIEGLDDEINRDKALALIDTFLDAVAESGNSLETARLIFRPITRFSTRLAKYLWTAVAQYGGTGVQNVFFFGIYPRLPHDAIRVALEAMNEITDPTPLVRIHQELLSLLDSKPQIKRSSFLAALIDRSFEIKDEKYQSYLLHSLARFASQDQMASLSGAAVDLMEVSNWYGIKLDLIAYFAPYFSLNEWERVWRILEAELEGTVSSNSFSTTEPAAILARLVHHLPNSYLPYAYTWLLNSGLADSAEQQLQEILSKVSNEELETLWGSSGMVADYGPQARAWTALALVLSEPYAGEAWQHAIKSVASIKDEDARARLLVALAAILPEEHSADLLKQLDRLSISKLKVKGLTDWALRLEYQSRYRLVDKIIDISLQLGDPRDIIEPLEAILEHIPAELSQEALSKIRKHALQVDDQFARSYLLSLCSLAQDESVRSEIWAEAHSAFASGCAELRTMNSGLIPVGTTLEMLLIACPSTRQHWCIGNLISALDLIGFAEAQLEAIVTLVEYLDQHSAFRETPENDLARIANTLVSLTQDSFTSTYAKNHLLLQFHDSNISQNDLGELIRSLINDQHTGLLISMIAPSIEQLPDQLVAARTSLEGSDLFYIYASESSLNTGLPSRELEQIPVKRKEYLYKATCLSLLSTLVEVLESLLYESPSALGHEWFLELALRISNLVSPVPGESYRLKALPFEMVQLKKWGESANWESLLDYLDGFQDSPIRSWLLSYLNEDKEIVSALSELTAHYNSIKSEFSGDLAVVAGHPPHLFFTEQQIYAGVQIAQLLESIGPSEQQLTDSTRADSKIDLAVAISAFLITKTLETFKDQWWIDEYPRILPIVEDTSRTENIIDYFSKIKKGEYSLFESASGWDDLPKTIYASLLDYESSGPPQYYGPIGHLERPVSENSRLAEARRLLFVIQLTGERLSDKEMAEYISMISRGEVVAFMKEILATLSTDEVRNSLWDEDLSKAITSFLDQVSDDELHSLLADQECVLHMDSRGILDKTLKRLGYPSERVLLAGSGEVVAWLSKLSLTERPQSTRLLELVLESAVSAQLEQMSSLSDVDRVERVGTEFIQALSALEWESWFSETSLKQ